MQKNKNIVKAINRNVRSSPRKINNLLKNIRGKKADIAIRDLSFARQRIAFDIRKTVQSAVANAENNNQYDIDNLYVKEAYVGKSIVLKRFRARAKGRASGIKKPYSNLTIILSENIMESEIRTWVSLYRIQIRFYDLKNSVAWICKIGWFSQ